ncbi:MAG TPA: DUF378 domain-containing protein [archaeon]|jgi:uncharacterized protein|nr:DUF378 domain-containing protein [archaeon]HOZ35969.1 DUF378 domain-containing protein [archaeon]
MAGKRDTISLIALILIIVGGLNWLLVGLFSFNLVTTVFGAIPILVTIVYTLVGLAAIWAIIKFKSI